MSLIPFGLVGVVIGPVVMGLDWSMVSGFGLVALTGIVVNDSLIMVDVIKRHQQEVASLIEVVILAGTVSADHFDYFEHVFWPDADYL